MLNSNSNTCENLYTKFWTKGVVPVGTVANLKAYRVDPFDLNRTWLGWHQLKESRGHFITLTTSLQATFSFSHKFVLNWGVPIFNCPYWSQYNIYNDIAYHAWVYIYMFSVDYQVSQLCLWFTGLESHDQILNIFKAKMANCFCKKIVAPLFTLVVAMLDFLFFPFQGSHISGLTNFPDFSSIFTIFPVFIPMF